MGLLDEVHESLPQLTAQIFGRFEHPLSELDRRLWNNCQWAFRADATYERIAQKILRDREPYDVTAVYFGGVDVVSHRFWRYMKPGLFTHKPTRQQVENLGDVIEDYYAYIDGVVARLAELAGPGSRIIVVSDHGFHAGRRHREFNSDDPPKNVNSGHHMDAPPGVIIVAGPDIARMSSPRLFSQLQRSDLPVSGSVMDVAPTLLAMMGIPPGKDMDGRVREDLISPDFIREHPPIRVASHDTKLWRAHFEPSSARSRDESERHEQLKELGYIE
jgi:hypothetical protein